MNRKQQSGMTLMEVLAALAIVGVMIVGTMTVVSTAHHLTRNTTNKEFATQKAISILEELKTLVETTSGATITTLDDYDDGANRTGPFAPLLTTQGQRNTPPSVKPDDPISGNTMIDTTSGAEKWLYERHISVQKLPGRSNDVRLVNVQVWINQQGGPLLLAEVASVIRTVAADMPPTQVYDVYALALENVPGWWVYMSNVVPFVRSAINDLQARNPGLVFRTTWVTTLSYGRDNQYRPFINDQVDSIQPVRSVYFYPGSMPASCTGASPVLCGDNYYYPAFFFNAHINVDGNDRNGYDATTNPVPYALADQYNHSMRSIDERANFNARKAANPNEPITWRLLIDDMYQNPQNYTNALVINLHGELLPFPPVRNYSDAAKSPGQIAAPDLRGIRVVTHPEQLRYTNADAINLRVYSYLENPAVGPDISPAPFTIRISGTNSWNPAVGDIKVIHGGVDNDNIAGPDAYDAAPVNAPICPVALQPNQMCWSSALVGTDTVLTLFNSPLRTPFEDTGRGLAPEDRLYGLDYIPSPVEDLTTGAVQFSTDLTSTSIDPKNTARWIIKVPANALITPPDTILTVETRIGNQITSGTMYPVANDPPNLSRTYVWRGSDTYIFGNAATAPALPITERFQFQGDPRHLPYADLKRPHVSVPGVFPPAPPALQGSYESPLGMGYNRYFDDFEDANFNRGASAEYTSNQPDPITFLPSVEPFNIHGNPNANNQLSVRINGGAIINIALTNGNPRTAAQIATDMNNNALFSAVAIAAAVRGHVRVTSRARVGSSVQFDFTNLTSQAGGQEVGFDNVLHTLAAWPGWFYTVAGQQYGIKNNGVTGDSGWNSGGGQLEIDVHRMFQMVRSALVRSNAIWTTLTGFSYYYVGIGNEIGYDSANNFPNSVPVSEIPFTGAAGWRYENSITGTVKYIRNHNGINPPAACNACWWAKPWIGELYPDSQYVAQWLPFGNLPAGAGATGFVRAPRSGFAPFTGTSLEDTKRRTQEMGSTTFFWTGTPASTFHHEYKDGDTSAIQTAGQDIADHFSLPVPNTIDTARPFNINYNQTGYNPESFLQPGAYPPALTTAILQTYFLHGASSPSQGSALITLTDPATSAPAFIAVNGVSPSGVAGTTFVAKWSFLTLIQSYLNGGLYVPAANHIRQLPRVAITAPNELTNLKDPASIDVTWDTTWKRWDNLTYTINPAYANWFEALTMKYTVLYSPTNGVADPRVGSTNPTGWFYMKDNTPATLGKKPNAAHEIPQLIAGTTTTNTYTWSTPSATFPKGNYLIRVEAYREGWPLHYSFHQYRAYIQR